MVEVKKQLTLNTFTAVCLCVKLTEVWGAGRVFPSTQLKEATAEWGADFLGAKTPLTCISFRKRRRAKSWFSFTLQGNNKGQDVAKEREM